MLAVILIGYCAGGPSTSAQLPETEFFKLLTKAGVTPEELAALKDGGTVAKTLDTKVKQEITSLGVVRIENLGPISMLRFRESFDPKQGEELSSGGRFSDLPSTDDLRDLEISKDDVGQLIKCTVGNCDLNMPAGFITRARSIAGQADPAAAARQLIVEMLVGYAKAYLDRGDAGLGRYENRRKPVDLTVSHRELIRGMLFVNDLAPELAEYLRSFPNGNLENVESRIHWSIVDFGLKPSITLSHSAAYTQLQVAEEQHFVVSKQFYSSRYLDSSLTLTLLLRVSTGDAVDTYLVLADRSRSDALEGALGGFARSVVAKESSGRISAILDRAHLRLLAASRAAKTPVVIEEERSTIGRFLESRTAVYIAVAAAILAGVGFLLWRWRPIR